VLGEYYASKCIAKIQERFLVWNTKNRSCIFADLFRYDILVFMQRKTVFSTGEYYHVFNRGVDKRQIFLNERDYQRFMGLLFAGNNSGKKVHVSNHVDETGRIHDALFEKERTQLVDIVAFCLMPNHFHLLVHNTASDDALSRFMKSISVGYAMYFNKKNQRTGRLWENDFKAKHVNTESYLRKAFEYIHQNPFEEERNESRDKKIDLSYPWSSYDFYKKSNAWCPPMNNDSREEYGYLLD